MKVKLNNCCNRCRQSGLSLIELVAALAILGTILAGVVMAKARHTRQLAEAQRRLQALALADQTIAGWWMSEAGLPIDQTGSVGQDQPLDWRSERVPHADLERLGADVVRLEFRYAPRDGEVLQAEPVLVVEMAVPRDRDVVQDEGGQP